MTAQIVFVSLFLGIVAGKHSIDLQVTGPVQTVRLFIADREVGKIAGPPWHLVVDFGNALEPRELAAVGFDAEGREIARASQMLNLPRPLAEIEIAVDGAGATIEGRHLMNIKPVRASMTLDGKVLPVDKLHARLPKLDPEATHVVNAAVTFADGFVARREMVIESVKSFQTGAQLTPIMVRETAAQHPKAWDGCLADAGGRAVHTAAVEKPDAVVTVVRSPRLDEAGSLLNPAIQALLYSAVRIPAILLDRGTAYRFLWPVGEQYGKGQEEESFLFIPSSDHDAARNEFLRFLLGQGPPVDDTTKLRFADAVAVAGVDAARGAQRRAVVLILSGKPDASMHSPRAVRRYLASLGVPLFVWNPMSTQPASAEGWGEVEDVSTMEKLRAAVMRLRRALDEQRIAWVDADPLTALRLQANAKCGIEAAANLP